MELVGTREIVEKVTYLGHPVKPGTVHQWRKRGLGFPEPLITLATGPVWDWVEVERWLFRTGRLV